MGKPITITTMTNRTTPVRNFQKRKDLRRDLPDQPADKCLRNGDFVNVSPFQLSEEILQIQRILLNFLLLGKSNHCRPRENVTVKNFLHA